MNRVLCQNVIFLSILEYICVLYFKKRIKQNKNGQSVSYFAMRGNTQNEDGISINLLPGYV